MKAYVTSVGEKTTDICIHQLEKFGFEVVLLAKNQSWPDKYSQFIKNTEEDCIRVDADVLVNENVKRFEFVNKDMLMVQGSIFDMYKNNVWPGQPVYYNKEVFPIIRAKLSEMDRVRPETWAWRLPEINPRTESLTMAMGLHGFFSGAEAVERAYRNKELRGQLGQYDFELVEQLKNLK